ncbi:hypothetical protein CEXT_813391 [Caerostris extrusa]|uniref:Uncharacterized protein n=1 Tax=Caerostris extrusa TaxID=172846 RepID=A0AAV4XIN9_CAEEX|nr:hypothetical protein CEXT_813391 [Caerostris extrusa]
MGFSAARSRPFFRLETEEEDTKSFKPELCVALVRLVAVGQKDSCPNLLVPSIAVENQLVRRLFESRPWKGNKMPKSEIFRESVYLDGSAPEWELATNAAPNGRQGTRKSWRSKKRADIWRVAVGTGMRYNRQQNRGF